ncbi:Bug family tripartite tricarboxylate transporter substrate binding protein [Limnohabitans lacus]|jgi:tripartite-type tricarboxylate transporter receptor subunit TctC|uniref:Tripartite tricarboxylate transporter substrate binding protein n=1 Tax=Limnohabitans lacus TaxID=3045173 RepID=A0ABT6X465_9BURK|nr:tripartite tricarboxylate transporter substrate binding protein [Limnohabitans sp. HM2-2]MDI9232911.1 tripartite tricarboxylate transporter substrate binding protein [Limnohabitans sp. HM2-2]
MIRRQLLIALSATSLAMPMAVLAQTYPERPIKILQGFAPGGNADAIARSVSQEMSKGLGQSMVVEAQAGAGGTIAATTVSKARPDGYTLLLATGGHAVAGALYNNLAYRTVQDFEMVSTITYFPFLVVVPANSKYANLTALLAAAKANPTEISYGTAGIGSTHHLAGELLASMSKTQLLHVPFRGDSASLTALLSGEIPMIIAPPTAVMANIKGGKLRAIATTGPQRWQGLPDVPTVTEQGVTGYDVQSWAGLMAPASTPRAVIDRLNAELQKAIVVPAVKSRLEDMGGEVRGSTPEEMRSLVASQTQKWIQVVNDAKIPKQ